MKEEEEEKEPSHDFRCFCGEPAAILHTCPYKEEIDGDYDSTCYCCKYCERSCADDV